MRSKADVQAMRLVLAARAKELSGRLRPYAAELMQNRFFLSCVFHGLVLVVLLNAWWFGAKRMKPAGSALGVQVMMMTAVGQPSLRPAVQRRPETPKHLAVRASVIKSAPAPEAEASSTAEALGDGPATILFIQGFPSHPPPIPGGDPVRDLIVDLRIDETGRVLQTHKEHGIGASVDDVIVATLHQWIFQPAIKAGKAIPSVQELHFHFDSRSNPACGWECIQLMGN